MAACSDAAAAPGPKDGAFMSFNVVCSSPNSVNLPLTHKESLQNTYMIAEAIGYRQRVQTPTLAGSYWEATMPLFTAEADLETAALAYWRYPHKARVASGVREDGSAVSAEVYERG